MNSILKQELRKLKTEINAQISVVESDAKRQGIYPVSMRTADGGFVMIPLLAAKATVLSALTNLEK